MLRRMYDCDICIALSVSLSCCLSFSSCRLVSTFYNETVSEFWSRGPHQKFLEIGSLNPLGGLLKPLWALLRSGGVAWGYFGGLFAVFYNVASLGLEPNAMAYPCILHG